MIKILFLFCIFLNPITFDFTVGKKCQDDSLYDNYGRMTSFLYENTVWTVHCPCNDEKQCSDEEIKSLNLVNPKNETVGKRSYGNSESKFQCIKISLQITSATELGDYRCKVDSEDQPRNKKYQLLYRPCSPVTSDCDKEVCITKGLKYCLSTKSSEHGTCPPVVDINGICNIHNQDHVNIDVMHHHFCSPSNEPYHSLCQFVIENKFTTNDSFIPSSMEFYYNIPNQCRSSLSFELPNQDKYMIGAYILVNKFPFNFKPKCDVEKEHDDDMTLTCEFGSPPIIKHILLSNASCGRSMKIEESDVGKIGSFVGKLRCSLWSMEKIVYIQTYVFLVYMDPSIVITREFDILSCDLKYPIHDSSKISVSFNWQRNGDYFMCIATLKFLSCDPVTKYEIKTDPNATTSLQILTSLLPPKPLSTTPSSTLEVTVSSTGMSTSSNTAVTSSTGVKYHLAVFMICFSLLGFF